MAVKTEFIIFQVLILAPFVCGYLLKNRIDEPEAVSKKIINANLLTIEPLIALWAVWGLEFKSELVFLPAAGLALVLAGLALGFALLSFTGIKGIRKATLIISTSIANHGYTMGGFLCYFFLGEEGLGLALLFISYFMPYIFIVIFPYAKISSGQDRYRRNPVRGFFLNFQNMPFYAILTAIFLKIIDIPRPEIHFPLKGLLAISILAYYFSLGINFDLRGLRGIAKENFYLALIKFLIIPAAAVLILSGISLDSSIKTIIIIQSFMPAAIYSVVTAVLFDLDAKLATGLFVINTLVFLLIVLPAMFLWQNLIINLL